MKNLEGEMSLDRYLILGMILIALFVFGKVTTYQFLNWDDDIHIYANPYLKKFTLSNFLHFWKRPHEGLYIPLTYTLWMVQAKLSGIFPPPFIFHLTNLIFHILNMLIVFLILRLLVKDDWSASAGALLFAIHPMQVESVAWISEFKGLLSAFFSLISIWQYTIYGSISTNKEKWRKIKQRVRPPNIHYFIATISFALAILAKPNAIAVPLVAGIINHSLLKRKLGESIQELLPWVILTLPVIALTKFAQPEAAENFTPNLLQRLLIAGDAITFYANKLILPVSLGPDYGRTPKSILQSQWIYFTGVLPYLLSAILAWKKSKQWLVATIGIFAASLLPVLGFVPFSFQSISTVADRYIYLAMLGSALGIAWILCNQRNVVVRATCIFFLATLGIWSFHQIEHWKNSYVFFNHALAVNPNSIPAHNNLGNLLRDEGNIEEAITHYKKVLSLNPNDSIAHSNLGYALQKEERFEEALFHYQEALKIRPDYPEVLNNLGQILYMKGKLDEAITYYRKSIMLNPESPQVHNNLAVALERKGKPKEALTHYIEAIRLKPDYVNAHYNLANFFHRQGEFNEAIKHYREVLRLNPNHSQARSHLESLLEEKQQ